MENEMKEFNFALNLTEEVHVASISGGKTSHFMIDCLIKKYGKENVHLVYCDTGAEHDGTYKFIRETEQLFGLKINCIRLAMPKEEGVGADYEEVSINEIKRDFKAFNELMEKYGRPFNPGGKFCTDQMKTRIYKKYCDNKFGKGCYTTWIGYRDEPRDASRAWGHTLSGMLTKWFSVSKDEQGEFYKECCDAIGKSIGTLFDHVSSFVTDAMNEGDYKRICQVVDRVYKNKLKGYRFLFEISDFDNDDIIDWWGSQITKLEIPKLCGNCIFCIEKTVNQLSYLCHTQNDLAKEWMDVVCSEKIPSKTRKESEHAMYRNGSRKMSFKEVYDEAMEQPISYWEDKVNHEKKLSPCASGSCDLFNSNDINYTLDL